MMRYRCSGYIDPSATLAGEMWNSDDCSHDP